MNQILKHPQKLDKQAWLLICTGMLFTVATALSDTFVNIYLWKIKQDLIMISSFHLANYTGSIVSTILASGLIKSTDRVINIRLGIGILSLFYLLVLWLESKAIFYIWGLGALLGLGNGFFWLSSSVMYFEITNPRNRDPYNGMNGLFLAIAGIISPLLSAFVITSTDHQLTGYQIIFAVSLLLFLITIILSFFFRSRDEKGEFRLVKVLSKIMNPKEKWCWVGMSMILQGFREGVLLFLIGLLVFETTKNEMTLGWFLTFSAVVSLLASFVLGKWISSKQREMSMWFGTIFLGVLTIPYLLWPNLGTIFLVGLGNAFFYPFYYFPMTSMIFDALGESKEKVALRSEYTAIKDVMLYLGRICTVGLFIWWITDSQSIDHLRWYLLFISFVQVPICYLMHKMKFCEKETDPSPFRIP